MTRLSRWMPAFKKAPAPARTKVALAAIGLACMGAVIRFPEARVVGAGLVMLLAAAWLHTEWRLGRISSERHGEDIGSFARAFDRRSPEFDPWVVRAVWDALQPYRTHRHGVAPLRPSDRLASFMDLDDLDDVVAPEIAQRAARTLDNPAANPGCKCVETVEDLVCFFWHQPRREQPNNRMQATAGGMGGDGSVRGRSPAAPDAER